MLEELFGYSDPRIIDALATIQEEKVIEYGSYIVYVYSLYHLSSMLYSISTFRLQSEYYEQHPLTIHDLIYKRRLLEDEAHQQELTKGCSQQELTKGCSQQELTKGCSQQELTKGCSQQELTKGCSQQELTKLYLLPLTRREGLSLDLIKDITRL